MELFVYLYFEDTSPYYGTLFQHSLIDISSMGWIPQYWIYDFTALFCSAQAIPVWKDIHEIPLTTHTNDVFSFFSAWLYTSLQVMLPLLCKLCKDYFVYHLNRKASKLITPIHASITLFHSELTSKRPTITSSLFPSRRRLAPQSLKHYPIRPYLLSRVPKLPPLSSPNH